MAVRRALRQKNFRPFHFQRVEDLQEVDFAPRLQFANWILRLEREQENFAKRILFTDHAIFTREGVFNYQSSVHWDPNHPHVINPFLYRDPFGVNVWFGIVSDNLIGPYFIPKPMNCEEFIVFLQEVLPQLLENVPLNIRRLMWYQLDVCLPCIRYREGRQALDETFPNRWIGKGGPVAWPARSSDLMPLNYFLWGAMKNLVYETPVDSEAQLVSRIAAAAEEIAKIPDVFQSVRQSFHERCVRCTEVNGGNFEQLL